jgi:hypothetical protein
MRFGSPFLLVALAAMPATSQTPPSPEAIARAVRDLGDKRFAVREKASQFLWTAGRAGERIILRALRDSDLETARRAHKLLDRFRWGIYPDTPPETTALIEQYRSAKVEGKAATLKSLFDRGPAWYPLIARLLAAEDAQPLRSQIGQPVFRLADVAIRDLLGKHQFAALEDLLAIRLATGEDRAAQSYAICLLLRGRLEDVIDHYDALAGLPGRVREAAILAQLHRVQGDLAAARRAAERAADPALLQGILYEQGDWKALSALDGKLVLSDAAELRAAIHRLAGNTQAFEQAIAAHLASGKAKKPGAGDQVARGHARDR